MLHKIYMQHKKKVICYELEAQTQACYTKTLHLPQEDAWFLLK